MSIKSQLFQFLIKLYVKFVTKVTRGARTCIFNASPRLPLSSMEAMQRANKVVCYVPRRQPCTTIRRGCLETSPEQRSTAAKSTVRRNGSARNVLRNMGCSNSKICGIVEYKCDCGTLFSNCYFPIYICFVEEFSTLNYVDAFMG